jgi:hypothetical protein
MARPEQARKFRKAPSLYPISNRIELRPSGRVGDTPPGSALQSQMACLIEAERDFFAMPLYPILKHIPHLTALYEWSIIRKPSAMSQRNLNGLYLNGIKSFRVGEKSHSSFLNCENLLSGRRLPMFRGKIKRPYSGNFYFSWCSCLVNVAYFVCREVGLRLPANKGLRIISGRRTKSE